MYINYSLTTSKKVKRPQLKISHKMGLQVIYPYLLPPNSKDISKLIHANSLWINKNLPDKFKQQTVPAKDSFLPSKIFFSASKKSWEVHYHFSSSYPNIKESDNEILISGNYLKLHSTQKILTEFVYQKGMETIREIFESIQIITGIRANYLTFKKLHSQWGNCNTSKGITLNYDLIFMPIECIKYIIIHELCHTKVMNHSSKFWNLVKRFDHNFQTHRKMLKDSDIYIPDWFAKNYGSI